MTRRERIEATLRAALAPEELTVADESAQHAGHAGAAAGGGHFRALIVSQQFHGEGLVDRHRRVYAALGDAMRGEIHALALETFTPEEWRARARR